MNSSRARSSSSTLRFCSPFSVIAAHSPSTWPSSPSTSAACSYTHCEYAVVYVAARISPPSFFSAGTFDPDMVPNAVCSASIRLRCCCASSELLISSFALR